MKNLLKRLGLWLLHGVIGLVFVLFMLVVLTEWMAGCGETYIDSKGVRHQHECVFLKR